MNYPPPHTTHTWEIKVDLSAFNQYIFLVL
ncbi:hypothetical protein Rain11_2241 [Raineya orbicola]|uniref:Uncharacterized protein n=1 Tax=Raineya orbicola TaxID=2016530 RepID=A0A2N3I9F1_9BACT|nr:hypothetical protein Rain11_2241 [Raineya orbicola]